MFCTSCGTEVGEADRFCAACGQPRGAAVPGRLNTVPATVVVANPKRGKKAQIVGVLIAMLGFFITLAGCPAMLSQDNQSSAVFVVGAFVFLCGTILAAIGKFEHWYHAE